MSNQGTRQYLVISAQGSDRPGIVSDLSQAIVEAGCNILTSQMTVLGAEFAAMLLLEGSWSAVAKLEAQLPGLQKKLEIDLLSRRTEGIQLKQEGRPYLVEVIALDRPGVIQQLAQFFTAHQINIQDLHADSYRTSHSGTQMLAVTITINLPGATQIARLRDEFLDFCDALNLDAILEPVKN